MLFCGLHPVFHPSISASILDIALKTLVHRRAPPTQCAFDFVLLGFFFCYFFLHFTSPFCICSVGGCSSKLYHFRFLQWNDSLAVEATSAPHPNLMRRSKLGALFYSRTHPEKINILFSFKHRKVWVEKNYLLSFAFLSLCCCLLWLWLRAAKKEEQKLRWHWRFDAPV